MTCSSCVADLPFELDDAFSKHVFLHRALLKDDMIELFSDPSMINVNLDVTVIGNDGNPEEGTGVGVMREVLTSFWQLVYHSLTVGTQEKVPCIRHELQKTQWEAIARVIVYGRVRNCDQLVANATENLALATRISRPVASRRLTFSIVSLF